MGQRRDADRYRVGAPQHSGTMSARRRSQERYKYKSCTYLVVFPNWIKNRRLVCHRFPGEKLIQLASDSLVTEILIHPQLSTLKQCMRYLLASFTRHRHVIHAGYTLSGPGSWILQVNDDLLFCFVFSFLSSSATRPIVMLLKSVPNMATHFLMT